MVVEHKIRQQRAAFLTIWTVEWLNLPLDAIEYFSSSSSAVHNAASISPHDTGYCKPVLPQSLVPRGSRKDQRSAKPFMEVKQINAC